MAVYSDIKDVVDPSASFVLTPVDFDKERYLARVDRNIGWITRREQELLRFSTVGIAGCGGMGGLLAATLLRAGIGHIKVADPEAFDASNLNRQLAATRESVGKPKALETARLLREIADDTHVHVYPQGISAGTVAAFSEGCDVICDEIEFWAIHARLLLHEDIGEQTTILNANSVGMGTRLFLFRKDSRYGMRDLLGMDLDRARVLEERIRGGVASSEEVIGTQQAVLRGLVPDLPEYMADADLFSNRSETDRRLLEEGKAPILASNPPMAAGFLANHVILELLRRKSTFRRAVAYPPDMPGYLYLDAALMQASVRERRWF